MIVLKSESNMDLILERIKTLTNAKDLTINKLTLMAGLSENTIYNWYSKGSEPSLHALKAICPILGVDLSCLVSEDETEPESYREKELLKKFRQLPENQKKLLFEILKNLKD